MLPQSKTLSAGSGAIVDAKNGYVQTNYHLVENASEIVAILQDKRRFIAEHIGDDPQTDIAYLEIDAKTQKK